MSEILTPKELISKSYPEVVGCVSPLVELIKVNPRLTQEVIELAIVFGIESAWKTIESNRRKELIDKIKASTSKAFNLYPYFQSHPEAKDEP